jgi:methylamine dehydrogenase accessory protein MauD
VTAIGVTTAFWFSYVLLWVLVVMLGLLVVLMYRQFGLAFMRPAERMNMQGLDVGSRAPAFALVDHVEREHEIALGARAGEHAGTAVVFALPTCQICAGLASSLASLPSDYRDVRFVWVDGESSRPPKRELSGVPGWLAGTAPGDRIHRQWDVSGVPFCFVVDRDGRIAAKRLVNARNDVAALLESALRVKRTAAKEGVPSE